MKSALAEFSCHGYAGARMDRIALQAKISKRMLFYYFGSKQLLFESVIESAWLNGEVVQKSPTAALEALPFWASFYLNNPAWTRIVGWEGLEWKKGKILRDTERRAFWRDAVELNTKLTRPGKWPTDMAPDYVLFSVIAIEMAPVLLPNLVSLILDRDANDPEFQKDWLSYMRSFSRVLMRADPVRKAAPPKKARARNSVK